MAPEDALTYITAGRGKGTLSFVGAKTGKSRRYTYKFSRPEEDEKTVFVRLLTGPNNESDYTYIGFMKVEGREEPGRIRPHWELVAGKKGHPKAPGFKALSRYLRAVQDCPEETGKTSEFQHEGICGVCGRTLTVPESIRSGIGPVCAGKMS